MLKLSDLIIGSSESLRAALQRMTKNRCGVLFVCDQNRHLVGVLSDGDVRRSLLDETMLVSPLDKIMNTDPICARTTEEGKALLLRLNIVALPVVDDSGNVYQAVIEEQDSVIVLDTDLEMEAEVIGGTGALAVIPARGGSKRIPRKNLAKVAGKSLLEWSIQAAKSARSVSHVLVSTDDDEIAVAARNAGADVPWLRPEPLSADSTPSIDVIVHALEWVTRKLTPVPEFAVLLEPTAPLRTGKQIDEAVSLLAGSDADCVASVSELPHVFHPEEVLTASGGVLQPFVSGRTMNSRRLRGEQNQAYVLNGLVYAFRINSVLSLRNLFGHRTIPLITRWEDFMDIDTPEDLEFAKFKMERAYSHIR